MQVRLISIYFQITGFIKGKLLQTVCKINYADEDANLEITKIGVRNH